jgi:hypothetical protein
MTLDELNQIENDLKMVDRAFPQDYSTATALELVAEVRKLLSTRIQGESQRKTQAEAAQGQT